ncbi:ABC transporter permease [Lentibacillus sp. N15]|uniref:ABC transporter permease n=1 Tax=Lentibacillus songyuanensis TaxID=3136161 RepID=UPI0031BA5FEE
MGMKAWLHAMVAVYKRNLKILRRQKQLLVTPFILPIVVLILVSTIMGGSDSWSIGLIDKSNTDASHELINSLESVHSELAPYFNVIETDPEKAKNAVEEGRLHMAITIPKDFQNTNKVYTDTYNINTDMMKNVKLRLEHGLLKEMDDRGDLQIETNLLTEKSYAVPRSAFFAGSAFLLSLMLSATIVAANLFSFDRENRTRKEILLTPVGTHAAGYGITLASGTVAILASLPTLLLGIFAFQLDLHHLLQVYLIMIPVMIMCATLGMIVAHFLKRFHILQPIIIITFIGTFFAAGGFAGVSMLPPIARGFSTFWLFSYVFEWLNPLLHGFSTGLNLVQYMMILLAGLVGVLLVPYIYSRELKGNISGGQ